MATTYASLPYALCPLDGRYADRIHELREYFSEEALMKARTEVEVKYLIALENEPGIDEMSTLSLHTQDCLLKLVVELKDTDIERIRAIERETNHDVKAVEYWLREQIEKLKLPVPLSFVHFALTSEDVTNLAYGLLINRALEKCIEPSLVEVTHDLTMSEPCCKPHPMLGMTHGQPATPTNTQEQFLVYLERLDRRLGSLRVFKMSGKFGGAVGNFSAHYAAYPTINWKSFGTKFVTSLGLHPLRYTTQINPHDDVAHLSHLMIETNTILLDLCVDMWIYISRGTFCEQTKSGEVGSSTMPNKVNPIDWENAEGNLGIANALFAHFAEKLPRSRLQRDLSDSTVQRWLGCAFGTYLQATKAIRKGLGKIRVNGEGARQEISDHPEVHAEAIQTVMRRYGYDDAYEQLKELTRGKVVTTELLCDFIQRLRNVPEGAKGRLYERIYKH